MEICTLSPILFTTNKETRNLYFVGDLHEGNINHAEKEFREAVKMIADDPGAIVILMGDYVEAIAPDDKKRFNPLTISKKYGLADLKDLAYKQIQAVYNNLEPIADKVKVVLVGNHEESFMKYHYSDIYERFLEMFPLKPFKIGEVGIVEQKWSLYGKEMGVIRIAICHGMGGGGYLPGYPINRVHQTFRWSEADINVQGHIHQLVDDTVNVVSSYNGKIKMRKRVRGASGCFLNTYQQGNANYFESRAAFKQTDIGMLKVGLRVRIEDKYNKYLQFIPERIKFN